VEGLGQLLGEGTGPARVGFEACRESRHVHDVVRSWGHEAYVFDTTRVRRLTGIGEHGRKSDRLDAEKLALALERKHAAFAHVLGDDARKLREFQESHRALVHTRKRSITHVRGILQGRGVRLESCAVENFVANVRKAELPESLVLLVEPLLGPLEAIEPALAKVDLSIHEICARQPDPVVERLASVPGVSLLVAAAFISTVDDPGRFQNASQVASYLGLCPREESTGGRHKLGSITKQGNAYARAMLVQAAWCIVRSRDKADTLVRWAHRTAERRGRMRAAVAVARRLARILWSLWKNGSYYDRFEKAPVEKAASVQPDEPGAQEQAKKCGVLKLARQKRGHERVLQAGTRQGVAMP
jgi:transposase